MKNLGNFMKSKFLLCSVPSNVCCLAVTWSLFTNIVFYEMFTPCKRCSCIIILNYVENTTRVLKLCIKL